MGFSAPFDVLLFDSGTGLARFHLAVGADRQFSPSIIQGFLLLRAIFNRFVDHGFAAGCEAWALPRRSRGLDRAMPLVRALPFTGSSWRASNR